MNKIPEIIKITCRKLRNNSTKAEIILWWYIKWKQLWYKFLRQYPLYVFTENSWLDRYIIPDFYCKEKWLIIELDWSVHNKENVCLLDLEKEKLITNKWLKILRFTNNEVLKNTFNTLKSIKEDLK